jgi:hypothetical protein
MVIKPIDRDALRRQVRGAVPFPHFCIEGFLDEEFAERVLEAFPSYEEALKSGRCFKAVDERGKVQVTDTSKFAGPIAGLNQAPATPEFLGLLSDVFDIPAILADEQPVGGGIHQTGPRGHLDVHVDFNDIQERDLHRRLNIPDDFNKDWRPESGGNIGLWDQDVKVCHRSFSPILDRWEVFETDDCYHGVSAVNCPEGKSGKSLVAYDSTREAPAHWTGASHSTLFKARPDEVIKGKVLVPLERAKGRVSDVLPTVKRKFRG